MQSKATTVSDYLKELSPERKKAIQQVRKVILAHLPKGYKEVMQYGMISYVVPLTTYPKGYLGKKDVPLPYVSLGSQKNYMAVYLLNIYSSKKTEQWFTNAYKKSGKKLDMGKSCVRFKTVDDVAINVIGEAVALHAPQEWIDIYEQSRKK